MLSKIAQERLWRSASQLPVGFIYIASRDRYPRRLNSFRSSSVALSATLPFAGTIISPRERPPISCCGLARKNVFRCSLERRSRLQICVIYWEANIYFGISLYCMHYFRETKHKLFPQMGNVGKSRLYHFVILFQMY